MFLVFHCFLVFSENLGVHVSCFFELLFHTYFHLLHFTFEKQKEGPCLLKSYNAQRRPGHHKTPLRKYA